jgi:hypothetical protein
MGAAGFYRVGFIAGQVFQTDFFTQLGLHKSRTGNTHEAGVFALNDEVLHHRVIGLTAQTGAHQDGDLGNDAGSQDLRAESPAVGFQGVHPFLQTGAAGIVHADERPALSLAKSTA